MISHLLLVVGSLWALPPSGSCLRDEGVPGPGEILRGHQLERLEPLLPPEVWEHREHLFFEDMGMRIGPCFRDYSPSDLFAEATETFAGSAKLDEQGKLEGHTAGLPFPPDTIHPSGSQAGLKWAWNWARRYTAAGGFGSLRVSIVGDRGTAARWEGHHFFVRLYGRADQSMAQNRSPMSPTARWAAGGTTKNMRTGNQCSFRQYGYEGRGADFFVAASGMRKLRRLPAPATDGVVSSCLSDQSIRAGLVTHGHRPDRYNWEIVGVADFLAPINSVQGAYPGNGERTFGPRGISLADDRWELRRVISLRGRPRGWRLQDGTSHFVWYLDLQTLQPLYYVAYESGGRAVGLAQFLTRWSEDRLDYPDWPDDPGREVRVLDRVAAIFIDWRDQNALRLEMGDRVAVPRSDAVITRMVSLSSVHVR